MADLSDYRKQIDDIDEKILNLLYQRFEVVKKIWEYKKDNNILILQDQRRKEVLEAIKNTWSQEWLNPEMLEDLRNRIRKESMRIQNN